MKAPNMVSKAADSCPALAGDNPGQQLHGENVNDTDC
jgi:hypothetical protein